MATPIENKQLHVITARSWIKRISIGLITIYTEVLKGNVPVQSALVEVYITRPEIECLDNNRENCKEKLVLFDNGGGDPDITKGDGIYSRYYKPKHEGSYAFEIVATDNSITAYTLGDMNNDNMDNYCCGSYIPFHSKKTIPAFQRFLPTKTLFFTKEQIIGDKTASHMGRIGDLRVAISNNSKIFLKWTSPDIGGERVTRYEVIYANHISDLIGDYPTKTNYWTSDTPQVFAIGEETSFFLNLNDTFISQHLYFALRAFSNQTKDSMTSPISNWVYVYIAPKEVDTNLMPNINNLNNSSGFTDNNGFKLSTTGSNTKIKFNTTTIIVLCFLIFFIILFLIVIMCLIFIKRRNNVSKNNNKKVIEDLNRPTKRVDNGIVNAINDNSLQKKDTPNYYQNRIIINENSSIQENNFTISNHVSLVNKSQEQLLSIKYNNDELNYSSYFPSQQILSPYESWTASQLLQKHEKRTPVIINCDEIVYNQEYDLEDSLSISAAPIIPPLPSFQKDNFSKNNYMSSHANSLIAITGNTLGIPNKSSQGSVCSMESNEKRIRNITMV